MSEQEETRCALCERRILPGHGSRHHLKPKLKGGTKGPTVDLHNACHSKIHSVFTEAELARSYNTIEKLLASEEIAKFVRWIQKRPPEFKTRNKSLRRQRKE